MKDLFSSNPELYARFRPQYPESLFQWLAEASPTRQCAWDVGTGNGQAARHLANFFDAVMATDISAAQLKHAYPHPAITYSVQPAEKTNFLDHSVDLVVVAQAVHWFKHEAFYNEVQRVIRPHGLLALIGYGLMQISPALDDLLLDFYRSIIGPYWEPERRYIDDRYQTLPFPYPEISVPTSTMQFNWSVEDTLSYLNTWSAVRRFREVNQQNPFDTWEAQFRTQWGNATTREVSFPLFIKAGFAPA